MSQIDPHAFSIDQLGPYLEAHIPGFKNLFKAEKFAGGQSNPTFLLEADSGKYVLRRKPPGELLKSAHAVDREFRVISALAQTDVPVAAARHLCEDDSVIGSMFYVMDFVPGRVLWDAMLPELDNAARGEIYDEMNRVMVALHSVDIDAVGLQDFGRPGNYYERQVSRWTKQYRASETDRIDAMEQLIAWLGERVPPDDGRVSLVHGDYRLDNIMFHASHNTAAAVLDWELSTIGHPFADLAYQCMQWRLPSSGMALSGFGDTDRNALGIPSEEQYVARYCERMGIDGIEDWNFYLAVSFFRLAAIVQGVYKRGLDGNASSDRAKLYGEAARQVAKAALSVLS